MQVRIKCFLPSSVSSLDRSPQAKKNLFKGHSTTKKSLNFSESTPSNATKKENMPLNVNQEIITPCISHFSAELNVENLCGKQTTQLKVLIINPNGRIESHCSFDNKTNAIICKHDHEAFSRVPRTRGIFVKVSLGNHMRDHLTFD